LRQKPFFLFMFGKDVPTLLTLALTLAKHLTSEAH
jgi:hypothetical protein